jgi:hypothetical protein
MPGGIIPQPTAGTVVTLNVCEFFEQTMEKILDSSDFSPFVLL